MLYSVICNLQTFGPSRGEIRREKMVEHRPDVEREDRQAVQREMA